MAVLRKLGSGMTWRLAQRKYGTDSGSTRKTVEPGTYGKKLEAAIYAAPKNELGRYANYVFEVQTIIPSHPTPMNVQRAAAWEVLAGERQQQALDQFKATFTAKWRARTTCAAPYIKPALCGNAPQPANG